MTDATLDAHLIAGQATRTPAAPTFRATNPATGEALAPAFPEATLEEATRAVAAADAAFDAYRARPGADRAALLEAIALELEALGDRLLDAAERETALPRARLVGERARMLNQLRIFAALAREGSWVGARIDHGAPDRKPLPKPDVRSMLVPLGPVAVFGASNFPLAISVAGTDTASALAVGCPVIVKAHPSHPMTSALVGAAIARAVVATKMPPGIFSMLHGRSHELGRQLVQAPALAAVAFTGSERAGRALHDAAASRPCPIPVFAELGSTNPVFLLPGALATRAPAFAAGFVASLTMGVGQYCTNPGLVFVCDGPGIDELRAVLVTQLEAFAPASMLNPGIAQAYQTETAARAQLGGVSLLARSQTPSDARRCQAGTVVFETSLDGFRGQPSLSHELFGPSSVLVRCRDLAAMAAAARDLGGQLTASVHGTPDDLAAASDLLATLERKVGRIVVDGFPTGIEVCAAMHHGGPYPASTSSQHTSIGHASFLRFVRPVSYQNVPDAALPPALQEANPLAIRRVVDERFA